MIQTSRKITVAPAARSGSPTAWLMRIVRSATDAARMNLSEAGGLKYKEIQPQAVTTVSTDK